ncbi:1435_t:CDS:2, partial [Dentiscutata heterogama]
VFKYFQKLAKTSYIDTIYKSRYCYENRNGIKIDKDKVVNYYQKLANDRQEALKRYWEFTAAEIALEDRAKNNKVNECYDEVVENKIMTNLDKNLRK